MRDMWMRMSVRPGDYGGSGNQNKAPSRQSLRPQRDALQGHRIDEAGAGGDASSARPRLELGEPAIDLHRGLDTIDAHIRLDKRGAGAPRNLRRKRTRHRPVVVEE